MARFVHDANARIAALIFLFSFAVYAYTSSPTINFWDCGEFVATSHTLGIPHQPGTPLYVLVGRVFSMLPLVGLSVAKKINLMSGFFGAMAVVFVYLSAVRLIHGWKEERESPTPAWLHRAAAASGALFLAFSTTFWTNAIEAEVYSMAAFVMSFCCYVTIRWYESRDRESSATLMLIIIYVMGLSVGFHLGSVLVFPGIFILVLLADRRTLRSIDLLIVSVVMGSFVLSTMNFPDALTVTLLVAASLLGVWRAITWGTRDESARGAYFGLAGIALFGLGLSVHFLMMIRGSQDPLINQWKPESFDVLMSVLRREQYPPKPPTIREASWAWQFGQLWGSSVWMDGTSLVGRKTVGYLQQFTFLPRGGLDFGLLRIGSWLNVAVPLVLWLFGMVSQFLGDRRMFYSLMTTVLINSVGLLVILNFNDHEVRDRDYFYFGFFQFLALFLALGAAGLMRLVWQEIQDQSRRLAVVRAMAAVLVLLPILPVLGAPLRHDKWFEHDNHRNDIARNYGWNILAGLPQNAILFTNGDNDTFPLWYLQEVEGFRSDVRVVNLSLINLPWYIKQLRDYEPTVPIQWTDPQIDGAEVIRFKQWRTRLVAQELPDGNVAYIRDITVWQIIENAGPERPVYYAVTVPNENIGEWVPYLDMEGLVFHVSDTPSEDGRPAIDAEKIWANFRDVYDFGGVLDEQGNADTSIYRDHNANHLLNNYPAALCRVGYERALEGDYDGALEAAEMAFRMSPRFPVVTDLLPMIYLQAGRIDEGLEATARLEAVLDAPDRAHLLQNVGEALIQIRQFDAVLTWGNQRVAMEPLEPLWPQLLFKAHLGKGENDSALYVLESYVARSGDGEAARELDAIRAELDRQAEERGDTLQDRSQ